MTKNSDEKMYRDGIRKLQESLTEMLRENPDTANTFEPMRRHATNAADVSFLNRKHEVHFVLLPRRDFLKACLLAATPLGFVGKEELGQKKGGIEQWLSDAVCTIRRTGFVSDILLPKRHAQRCESRKRKVVVVETEKGFGIYETFAELNILRKDLAVRETAGA